MTEWSDVLKNIDTDFRGRIEIAMNDLEREEAERFAMEQEEINMRKEIAREKREKRRAEKVVADGTVRVSRRRTGGS